MVSKEGSLEAQGRRGRSDQGRRDVALGLPDGREGPAVSGLNSEEGEFRAADAGLGPQTGAGGAPAAAPGTLGPTPETSGRQVSEGDPVGGQPQTTFILRLNSHLCAMQMSHASQAILPESPHTRQ